MPTEPSPSPSATGQVLITGGSGFVGVNLAHRLLSAGRRVLVLDNLSRGGVERNLAWLKQRHPDGLSVDLADIRDTKAVKAAVDRCDRVFHFAAQVAVTTSLTAPFDDLDINARGTLNVLEAVRAKATPTPLVFTSTNKVYGDLADVGLRAEGNRYLPSDAATRDRGIGENRPLDFHSPYGCSKGAADQYVLDYARTFGVPACVFRMSCIYGPHQCGTEDQGWVAHFLMKALRGEPINIYGDGMQVRDILFADDLVDAFLLAEAGIGKLSGHAFNIGGGTSNAISLQDLLDLIERVHGSRPEVRYDAWRPGDQRFYVSDTAKMRAMTGWEPKVSAADGIAKLYGWLQANLPGLANGASPATPASGGWQARDRTAASRPRAARKEPV